VGDARQRQQRLKPRSYDEPVVRELIKLWELLNYVFGKRLVGPYLALLAPSLFAKSKEARHSDRNGHGRYKGCAVSKPESLIRCLQISA